MTEQKIDYEAAEAELNLSAKPDLAELVALATEQLKCEERLLRGQDLEKRLKARLRRISEDLLPAAMAAVGVTTFGIENADVTVTEDMKMSLSGPATLRAIDWLKEIKEEGLIKTGAELDLGRGKDAAAKAEKLRKWAATNKVQVEIGDTVNTASLKALVKKRMKAGQTVPELKQIGGFVWKQSVVKMKQGNSNG